MQMVTMWSTGAVAVTALLLTFVVACGATTTSTAEQTTATSACPPGKYDPPTCHDCGQCKSSCNGTTGECDACHDGYDYDRDKKCKTECWPGKYGANCRSRCSTNCADTCNPQSGHCSCRAGWKGSTCSTPCEPGKYGANCNSQCSTNCANTCNPQTGHCTCKPGWKGSGCSTRCNRGTYGQNCTGSCGACSLGTTCDYITGHCPSGCRPGYLPTNRKCGEECANTAWGQNCTNTCSTHCVSSSGRHCDKTDGVCKCNPGYKPGLCVDRCESGQWGQNCTSSCSIHCENVCDRTNGECTCKPGYQPSRCTAQCASGHYGQNCDEECGFCHGGKQNCNHVTGNCSRCEDNREMPLCKDCIAGQWGPTCGQRCGHCGGDGRCDPLHGICLSSSSSSFACQDGWTSATCDVKCGDGTYGKDCAQKCGRCRDNSPCRHDNGICEQDCEDDYIGVLCQTEKESLVGVIVGSAFGAGILIVLAIVFAVWYLKRSKGGPQTPRKDFIDMDGVDNLSSQHVESSSRRASEVYQNVKTTATAEGSVHDYERTRLGQRDSHHYAAHAAPQDPAHHIYQNTGDPSSPDAKGQKRNRKGKLKSPAPTYGNLTSERPEATYGNVQGQGLYGNVS